MVPASLGSVGGAVGLHPRFVDGSIASPIEPALDVSRFERVLIAGFVTGGTRRDRHQSRADNRQVGYWRRISIGVWTGSRISCPRPMME